MFLFSLWCNRRLRSLPVHGINPILPSRILASFATLFSAPLFNVGNLVGFGYFPGTPSLSKLMIFFVNFPNEACHFQSRLGARDADVLAVV